MSIEDKILMDISNHSIYISIKYPGHISFTVLNLIEVIKIFPLYPFLKFCMRCLFEPLKPTLYNLDENVCFLHIDDKFLQLSCDWCSICNGIIETAKQTIINQPELVKQIDFTRLKYFDIYLDYILSGRTEKVTPEQTETWCRDTFGQATPDLLLFSRIYLKLEQIELRWCPFKRSKEFYYRNKDKRFMEPSEQTIYEVGKILNQYETITCNNCPRVVNAEWKYTKSNEDSMFQPLLDYMMREIREPTQGTCGS
jgi:hypothetical protein